MKSPKALSWSHAASPVKYRIRLVGGAYLEEVK